VLTAAVLFVAAGTLTGCMATPGPDASNTPAPAAATTPAPTEKPPLFASNDEALAAATAAFTNYLAAGDSAGAIGSDSWNAYMALTVGTAQEGDIAARKVLVEDARSLTGTTAFDSMAIQSSSAQPDLTWEIRTYLCLDVSGGHMIDANGNNVSTPYRQTRLPLVVVFVSPSDQSTQLLISESRVWSGTNFC
jgi:hypothetical protein